LLECLSGAEVILSRVRSEGPTSPAGSENGPSPRKYQRSRPNGADLRRLGENLREAHFPIALRGYDRDAVDRYVKEARRVITELELSASPEAAVRHALDEVSEETSGLLQRAYETAEEIQARSRAKADDRIQQAERDAESMCEAAEREAEATRTDARREADELLETARRDAAELRAKVKGESEQLRTTTEARVQELERHVETVLRERRRLIDDMRAVGKEQLDIAEAATARFPQTELDSSRPATPVPEDSETSSA
jgi:cell division septum initiation protein DivIVA